jgi:glucarate dehydratase
MKITDVIVIPVNVPYDAPTRWPFGYRGGATRMVIKVTTDEGLTGIGETIGHGFMPSLIDSIKSKVIGLDPFDINKIVLGLHIVPFWAGYAGRAAVAGIETACWDIMGRKLGLPLYKLLGGKVRENVEYAGYLFYRYEKDGVGGEDNPDKMAKYARKLQETMGFKTFKLKGGVFDPEFELQTLQAIQKELGREYKQRYDPNGSWSVELAMTMCPKYTDSCNIEYLEDIVWGLDASARLKETIRTPLATNMFVVTPEELPLNARVKGFDVILGDVFKWGGILASKKLAAFCEMYSWGMSMHSAAELGISTMITAHFVLATPQVYFPVDSHYFHFTDDVIKGGRLSFKDGCLSVPDKPGIGVDIDEEKLGKYNELYNSKGAIFHGGGDEKRLDLMYKRPIWT